MIELPPTTITRTEILKGRVFAMYRAGGVDLEKVMALPGFEWVERSLNLALKVNKPELAAVNLEM